MKKILFSSIGALLLLAACSPVNKLGRKPADGMRGLLILHPVESSAEGNNGKKYHFSYDYLKRYLYITDDTETYTRDIQKFLPEYIGMDSIGKGVIVEVSTADPFSNLTPEVRQKISETQGIEFNPINEYQIAKSFGIGHETGYTPAKQVLLDMLTRKSSQPVAAITPGRLPIEGAQGLLTIHPIKMVAKGIDGKDYYFFYDLAIRYIFITDDVNLYNKFSAALPVSMPIKNAVILQGIAIDPMVLFTPENINAMTKDQGFEIDGGKSSQKDLNKFTVARISNYGMVHNYQAIIKKLNRDLGLEKGVTNTNTTTNNKQDAPFQEKAKSEQQSPPAQRQQQAPPVSTYNQTW